MANFEEYRVFQNPHIFRMDFLHQQLVLPFPWPTPHIVDRPPEFLEAGIGHVASWSEADNRGGSSPCQKEETRVVEKSSSSFCAVVIQWWRRGPPLGGVPDLSGIVLLSAKLPLLPASSEVLPPTFSALRFSPLFGSDTQVVPSFPALEAGPPPRHIFWLIEPRNAYCRNRRYLHLRQH